MIGALDTQPMFISFWPKRRGAEEEHVLQIVDYDVPRAYVWRLHPLSGGDVAYGNGGGDTIHRAIIHTFSSSSSLTVPCIFEQL